VKVADTTEGLTILAIDPGVTGAMAFYRPEMPDRIAVDDMPVVDGQVDPHELRRRIALFSPSVAIIERVSPMPRDGVVQAWRFSAAYTTARVVCSLLHLPTSLVTPAKWKRDMKLKGGPEGKEQSRALAIQLFPAVAASFARKKDAGRAEAAILAYYAASKFVYVYKDAKATQLQRIDFTLPKANHDD
jgi:hypothetical protein